MQIAAAGSLLAERNGRGTRIMKCFNAIQLIQFDI